MEKLILTLHIIVCVVLVILVLLQSGKEGMGVIFGGGSSSLFGSTGAGGILVKLTTFVAAIFLATSLGYNMVSSAKTPRHSTVVDIPLDDPSAPAKPAAPANATVPANATTPAPVMETAPASKAAPANASVPAAPSDAGSAPTSAPQSSAQPKTPEADAKQPAQAVPGKAETPDGPQAGTPTEQK